MKKTKFVALALAGAIMLMGAGYAYWTDTLTITNTVQTGNFDVDFVSDPGDRPSVAYYKNLSWAAGSTFENTTIANLVKSDEDAPNVNLMRGTGGSDPNVTTDGELPSGFDNPPNKDKLYIRVNNMYPGAAYVVTGKIKNLGSIPVLFNDTLTYSVTANSPTTAATLQNLLDHIKAKVSIGGVETDLGSLATAGESISVPSSPLTVTGASSEAEVQVLLYFDKDTVNTDYLEDEGFTFEIVPAFRQFNAPAPTN